MTEGSTDASSSEGAPHPCRVAVCDDVRDFRELLSAMLHQAAGLEVVGEAANGQEAVELARASQPDVMLLDLSMPVMDGMEALPLIRNVAPNTKVIVLTGFGSTTIKERALECGATDYVEKGERLPALITRVQRICSG